MHSGVATMSRELVLGTVRAYDWVQIAGAIQHPDKGKVINMDVATAQITGVKDSHVTLYPVDGYGNEELLFAIIDKEKPDFIMHFTDPRFWGWLYAIERQIRSKMPLTYLNIWDDIPYPMYNRPYYESCDLLMSISKQTYNINKWVLGPDNCCSIYGDFDKDGNLVLCNKVKEWVVQRMIDGLRKFSYERRYFSQRNLLQNNIDKLVNMYSKDVEN